jgi:hypothetical protein
MACNSGTAPATVSESKAKLNVTAPRAWEDASPAKSVRESGDRPDVEVADTFAVGELGYVLMRRRQSRAVGRPRQRGLGTLTEADLDGGGTVGINVSAIQRIDLRGR